MTTLQPTTQSRPQLSLDEHLDDAIDRAVDALFEKQHTTRPWEAQLRDQADSNEQGSHWCAELEGDSILSSEYLLMKWALDQANDNPAALSRIFNHLKMTRRSDGTWGQYPDSPPDVSATVKAYVCYKLMGYHKCDSEMVQTREVIHALGGAEAINTFSMFYLACLGLVDWDACPAIPPEIVFLPRWFPFHLDKVSAWTRTMILPLAICTALRPVQPVPIDIDELFINQANKNKLNQPWQTENPADLRNVFLGVDRMLKKAQRFGLVPCRNKAIDAARRWILARTHPATTEGLGAIFPPMVYLQIAFHALGYERTDPVMQQAEAQLEAFFIDMPQEDKAKNHIRIQPCFSPVWDTGIALYALTEAGLTAQTDDRIARACDWLRDKQVTRQGDWANNLRDEDKSIVLGEDAAAWSFEYRNDWYPDVDDTAMIAKALWRAGDRAGQSINKQTAVKAFRWIRAMQNDDGGWAAFDRTKHRPWMELVPFADHNAMQDPSCPDITGRTIESLVTCGLRRDHPTIGKAVRYILDRQEAEGCWFGRWGVNYIYGTWQAVGGLNAAGLDQSHPQLAKTVAWLRSIQNEDGGFGESANSYLNRSLMGAGPSTASQTAWAVTTLLYLVEPGDQAVQRAIQWLIDYQLVEDKQPYRAAKAISGKTLPGTEDFADMDWMDDLAGGYAEHFYTGTGFPKVFYLRYHLYRHYFPLMALARYRNLSR